MYYLTVSAVLLSVCHLGSASPSDISEQAQQRVVVLPGPHKSGVSTVQLNLSKWTRSNLIQGWTWPTLQEDGWQVGKDYWRLVTDTYFGKEDRKQSYARLFQETWADGNSIVFGSDAFDHVTSGDVQAEQVMDTVLELMPWANDPTLDGSNSDITVVVPYRSPRVEHVLAIWQQVAQWGESLSQFLLHLPDNDRQWHSSLNPLGLADSFMARGVSAVLVDLDGLGQSEDDLSLSTVVACEVMNACSDKEEILRRQPNQKTLLRADERRGNMDLDEDTLDRINEVLVRLDASYCHMRTSKKVEVLHGENMFSWCDREDITPINSLEAALLIKDLVKTAATPSMNLRGPTTDRTKTE